MEPTTPRKDDDFGDEMCVITISPGIWTYAPEAVAELLTLDDEPDMVGKSQLEEAEIGHRRLSADNDRLPES
jgi:hypothetical protein